MSTLNERLTTVEANYTWIKEGLQRLEDKIDEHTKSSNNSVNGGVTISLSRKTLGMMLPLPAIGGTGGIAAILRVLGVI